MSVSVPSLLDGFDARIAVGAQPPLLEFNRVGVLSSADVHVAERIARLTGESNPEAILAAALAVRGPRLGHVFVDLATIALTATVESEEPVDLSLLPWPAAGEWVQAVRSSALVAAAAAPLRLEGSRLYLDRYWQEERRVAEDLVALSDAAAPDVDLAALAAGLERLFPPGSDVRQRAAAAAAVIRRLAVVGGGPGTGKTTTVARIVALLGEQAEAAGRPPLVALAAPTGKAAARLAEAVHAEAASLETSEEIRSLLLGLRASTLHRLLGWRPGSHSRFAHDRENRLPHDLVIVDETSMISLSLMARLVEAVRPDARLILVGDPGQLTSIEAGVVLGDIVGPAASRLRISPAGRQRLTKATGDTIPAEDPPTGVTIGDGIIVLDRVYRYGSAVASLADAIRVGNADGAIDVLRAEHEEITWLPIAFGEDAEDPATVELPAVKAASLKAGRAVVTAARAGDGDGALQALAGFRLLCAHRRGPFGVSAWSGRQQAWLAEVIDDLGLDGRDYVGRPLLVTENDYELGLYNGDTGVIVRTGEDHAVAMFERAGQLVGFSPLRLGSVETVYAMTIHKSQGSQFDTAAVLLPPADSPILTRELLYTAVTRARSALILVGSEATVRAAVERPVTRASGLRERLWG